MTGLLLLGNYTPHNHKSAQQQAAAGSVCYAPPGNTPIPDCCLPVPVACYSCPVAVHLVPSASVTRPGLPHSGNRCEVPAAQEQRRWAAAAAQITAARNHISVRSKPKQQPRWQTAACMHASSECELVTRPAAAAAAGSNHQQLFYPHTVQASRGEKQPDARCSQTAGGTSVKSDISATTHAFYNLSTPAGTADVALFLGSMAAEFFSSPTEMMFKHVVGAQPQM